MGTAERPEITYAVDPAKHAWPENWMPISEGTLERNRSGWELGFLAAHDVRLHSPTAEVPVDAIKSDVIQRVGRKMLRIHSEVWGGTPVAGSGLTANQVDLSEITPIVPSMSVMWVGGESRLVINPKLVYPEGFNEYGDANVGSEGCMNIRGLGGFVAVPNSLLLSGRTINGKALELELTDPIECRTAQHEARGHIAGKLYPEWVVGAGRTMYRVNVEEFAVYRAWAHGEDVGDWQPTVMPAEQYGALVDSVDPRMKLERFYTE